MSNSKWKILAIISTLLLIITISAVVFFVLGRLSANKNITTSEVESGVKSPIVLNSTSEVDSKAVATPAPTLRRRTTSPTPSSQTKTVTLKPIPALDGYRNSDGTGSSVQDIRVGFSTNVTTRGFVAFDLSDIPQAAEIAGATLRIFQIRVDENPFESGESIVIDHLNFGDSLDATDFAMPALVYSFSELSSTKNVGWREVDVTDYVRDDMANARSASKFRLHFANEDKTESSKDYVYFEPSEDNRNTGNTPEIVVGYR
jgi:hypothetical protein